MVLSWEQATGLLYSSGDVQRISLWDTHKEIKIQVMCVWVGLTLCMMGSLVSLPVACV